MSSIRSFTARKALTEGESGSVAIPIPQKSSFAFFFSFFFFLFFFCFCSAVAPVLWELFAPSLPLDAEAARYILSCLSSEDSTAASSISWKGASPLKLSLNTPGKDVSKISGEKLYSWNSFTRNLVRSSFRFYQFRGSRRGPCLPRPEEDPRPPLERSRISGLEVHQGYPSPYGENRQLLEWECKNRGRVRHIHAIACKSELGTLVLLLTRALRTASSPRQGP